MLPNVPVDFMTIPPFRKYVQGLLEIVDVFKASMDLPSTPRIVSNVDRWCERRYASNVTDLQAGSRQAFTQSYEVYELQFGQLGTSTPEFTCLFLPYILLSRYPLSYVYSHRPVRTSRNQNLKPVETNGRQK